MIELQSEVSSLERQLAAVAAAKSDAEAKFGRFTQLGGVSFGGIPIAQSWAELMLWESLLNSHKVRAVYELGTWNGGFAWWLWAQAQIRRIAFHTFDAVVPEYVTPPESFTRCDIFHEADKLSVLLKEWEPLILFCDNGNKPRELQTFGTMLQHMDSLVVVHDWGIEIQPEDVPDKLEMMHREFCEEIGAMSRVFRKQDA